MAMITLRVLDGADRGRVFGGLPTPVTIGREEGNVVQLNDERVSRYHLKIQEDQQQYVLTDLDSTNGTKVNGEDVSLRILRFGDIISVGRSVVLFGSREEIAERLIGMQSDAGPQAQTMIPEDLKRQAAQAGVDYEEHWSERLSEAAERKIKVPPELPQKLSSFTFSGVTASAVTGITAGRWYSVELFHNTAGGAGSFTASVAGNNGFTGSSTGRATATGLGSASLGMISGGAGTLIVDEFESTRSADTAIGRLCQGDTNGSGTRTIADAIQIRNEFLSGGATPAGGQPDANENGGVNISDYIVVRNFFLSGQSTCP